MSPGTAGAASGRPPSDARLPTSGHLLLTYHGETPPWRSAVAFLSAGLASDRRLVCLHDRSDPGEIADRLRGEDLDVDRLVASAQLQFPAAGDYHPGDGGFDPDRLVQPLRSGLVHAVRDGFDGLQMVGEAGWISGRVPPGIRPGQGRARGVTGGVLVPGLAGLVFLVLGGELLVRGSVRIADWAGLSPLVVGLTVVAFGTSAPELAVSAQASLAGRADLALGNVVGSNIFNVLFILGVSAMIVPLAVQATLVRREVPLMIGSGALLLLLAANGTIARWEGGLLVAGAVVYTAWTVRSSRREPAAIPAHRRDPNRGDEGRGDPGGRLMAIAAVAGGLATLVLGARWLVDAAVVSARSMGIDEFTIGVTVVAAGTSLPEVAASVTAAVRGQRDIAVGNVIGSNLLNVLGILGAAALLSPSGLEVAASALRFDLPVMIAVSVACLPVFFSSWSIDRWEGLILLAHYGAYVAYLLLAQGAHDALPAFSRTMWLFVLPATAAVLALSAWRSYR